MMKNKTQRGVINNIVIIIVLLIIVAVTGVYVLYKKPSIVDDSRIDGAVDTASPSITPASDQKELVYLELEKKQFFHDDKVFEPVHYTLINNSSIPIYFLSGCAVVSPEVYKVENNSQIRLIQEREIICQAEPQVNKVEPSERVGLGWDQKVLGKFVEDGQYRVAIKYSLEKINDYTIGPTNEALSGVFTVIQVRWTVTTQRKTCELFGEGFRTNGIIYTKDWCNRSLQEQ